MEHKDDQLSPMEWFDCNTILVSDHLLQAAAKSLHFGWLLTGGSTIYKKQFEDRTVQCKQHLWKGG